MILVVGGGIYIYNENETQVTTTATSTPVTVDTDKVAEQAKKEDFLKPECFDTPKYFVIKKYKDGELGEDIIVKSKTDSAQVIPCEYNVVEGDFVNIQGMNYIMIVEDLVLLDFGSAPGIRGLNIFDLKNKKNVFSNSYMKPIDLIYSNERVKTDPKYYPFETERSPVKAITYWDSANMTATPKNCIYMTADAKQDPRDFWISQKVVLNLSTWVITRSAGELECNRSQ